MASKPKEEINHFNNGYVSFPNRRILYPENPVQEEAWLAGWYQAKREEEIEIRNDTGIDTWLWNYRTNTGD